MYSYVCAKLLLYLITHSIESNKTPKFLSCVQFSLNRFRDKVFLLQKCVNNSFSLLDINAEKNCIPI